MVNPNQHERCVSLTLNVCQTDSPYIEKSLRHIVRSLNYPFVERLVALDTSASSGAFQQRGRKKELDLPQLLSDLKTEKLLDRFDVVPWTAEDQLRISQKFYGEENLDPKCNRGTAVYQYLFALDQCRGEYVLHVDSDMLFSISEEESWIDEGIELLQKRPEVAFVTLSHPPRAEGFLEFVAGKPLTRKQERWSFGQGVSTRLFLVDRKKMETSLLPLVKKTDGERLEQSFTNTLGARGFYQATLFSEKSWAIHPKPHNANYVKYLDSLIWAVENHVYPFRRFGPHPWDLSTYTRYLPPWIWVARKASRAQS
jgi:hypothetical protein